MSSMPLPLLLTVSAGETGESSVSTVAGSGSCGTSITSTPSSAARWRTHASNGPGTLVSITTAGWLRPSNPALMV